MYIVDLDSLSISVLGCADTEPLVGKPLSSILNATELELLKLKSEECLSTGTLNKIIQVFHRIQCTALPVSYNSLEQLVFQSTDVVQVEMVKNVPIHYISVQRWLPILVQLNIVSQLITRPSSSVRFGDISSGTWFREFLGRVPSGFTPLALDVYYDHWGVSKSGKVGGLYIAVANSLPAFLMKPSNKFVCCLVPSGVDIQSVLLLVLKDLVLNVGKFVVNVEQFTFHFYVEIARLVGDIPGLAEVCGVLNHAASSLCRKCEVKREQLMKFPGDWSRKTQRRIFKILRDNI
jgi:hypothetical protein